MNRVILFFLTSLFFSLKVYSQNEIPVDTSVKSNKLKEYFKGADIVLGEAKHPPEFPGGKTGWIAFLKKNIDQSIPFAKKAPPGTYVVSIRFTVGKDGILRNIGAETGCGYGMEDEVIRSMKLSPTWKPAQTTDNEIVNFATRQIVFFKIKGTEIQIEIR